MQITGNALGTLQRQKEISPFFYSQVRDNSSRGAQSVKNPPAMQQILVQFLGQEDPLEQE